MFLKNHFGGNKFTHSVNLLISANLQDLLFHFMEFGQKMPLYSIMHYKHLILTDDDT